MHFDPADDQVLPQFIIFDQRTHEHPRIAYHRGGHAEE